MGYYCAQILLLQEYKRREKRGTEAEPHGERSCSTLKLCEREGSCLKRY